MLGHCISFEKIVDLVLQAYPIHGLSPAMFRVGTLPLYGIDRQTQFRYNLRQRQKTFITMMNTEEFLANVKDVLEIEDREIAIEDEFRSYDEWSSLAFLSLIAMIDDEYDVILDGNTFKTLITLGDVMKAIETAQA